MDNKLLNEYLNNNSKFKISACFTKILLSVMLLLISLIYVKNDDNNLANFKKYVFEDNFNFSSFQGIYNDLKGNENVSPVISSVKLSNKTKYHDGVSFKVNDELVQTLSSGIVVFIGDKEDFKNTVIIQGSDGYDIWYGNLENINISIYDYLNKDTIIGNTDTLFIKIVKDGKTVNFDDYLSI